MAASRAAVCATAVRGSGRLTVPLFLICYIVAQADKQALGLTVAAIQSDVGITDTQVGLLQGAVFALAFSFGGLPMGWLVDRYNRIHIAATCIVVWSLATSLSGLAGSFEALAILRAVTAFFEAGLAPAAFSLFSDRLGAGETARASATYMLAPFLGAGVAMIGGAAVGHLLPHWPFMAGLGWDAPWRLVFLLIGVPGVAVGLALPMLLKDRRTREAPASPTDSRPAGWSYVFCALFSGGGFLRSYQFGMASFVMFLSTYIAWFPAYLIRSLGYDMVSTGTLAGAVYMTGGVAGTLFTISRMKTEMDLPRVVGWLTRAVTLLIPVAALLPLVSSMSLLIIVYAAFAFLTAMVLAVMIVPIQLSLPVAVQGRAIGVFTLMVTGVAGSLGPLIVGTMTQRSGLALGSTLFIVGLSAICASTALMRKARRRLVRQELARSG